MIIPRLLWPEARDIAVAPEIGVIALLDAACAASVAHLLAVNHEIASAEDACRGDLPPYAARSAARLIARIHPSARPCASTPPPPSTPTSSPRSSRRRYDRRFSH